VLSGEGIAGAEGAMPKGRPSRPSIGARARVAPRTRPTFPVVSPVVPGLRGELPIAIRAVLSFMKEMVSSSRLFGRSGRAGAGQIGRLNSVPGAGGTYLY
jgi:hypothetical protein